MLKVAILDDYQNISHQFIDIEKLSVMALDDPSTNSNPKKLTLNDMKTMYQYSMIGKLF